ncbi:ATP-dependent helicase [Kamptonema cortianum]|nr:ATP-dependent helicase [Kamptonema cortianum]MDL5050053.1 ATP-dependent helicase [Oscillatoria amoena NRMC-F 0135]
MSDREYELHHPSRPLSIDYRQELNEQQYTAVTSPPGPILVIAGAGSGKTRTLTYRVAYLIDNGVAPENILLLTFTNKAAREMLQRVEQLVPQNISRLWGGTFHHVANRILRRHATLLGYQADFTIIDRDDAKSLLNLCMDDAKIDRKDKKFPKADVILEIFSYALNTQTPLRQIIDKQFSYFEDVASAIERLYPLYQSRKLRANSMDYDDLLINAIEVFKKHPEVLEHYQRQFQFLLVDEYQDTNAVQFELIETLARAHGNIMVVGDDAQSIYSWRGANFTNILKFPDRYPGAQVHKIEINYRSTPEILHLANEVIRGNTRQFEKELRAVRKSGVRPVLVPASNSSEQAAFVCQRLLEIRDEGISLNDCAVLYRSHFHAMELQMEMTRRQIPYLITSGLQFFEQAHIKDVSAFLKVAVNPSDEVAFRRIMNMLPGIGRKTADKIWTLASAGVAPDPDDLLANKHFAEQFWVNLTKGKVGEAIPAKAYRAWSQVVRTLQEIKADSVKSRVPEQIKIVVEAYYDDYLKAEFTNYQSRLEDLNQLAVFARNFDNSADFLGQLSLMTSVEIEADRSAGFADGEYIRLSTVHQAKGLEWPVVFIIGLADGMFPNARALEAETEAEEEERRLFYVAVTRAKDELYMLYPVVRQTMNYSDMLQGPSRFLSEIPRGFYDEWRVKSGYTAGSGGIPF